MFKSGIMKNNGHTGGNQPMISPSAVAPLVENFVGKYARLKRVAHNFIVSLPPSDPVWENPFFPILVLAVLNSSQFEKMVFYGDK